MLIESHTPARLEGCTCQFEWKQLATLGAPQAWLLGKGWVRTTTDPDCVRHGIEAEAEWQRRHRSTAFTRAGLRTT